jgi:intracellular septation protein
MAKNKSKKREPKWVKALTEYIPLILFFLAYKAGDLTLAIQVIVVATVAAVVISYAAVRRLPLLTILAGGLVLAFGGLSLLLGDDRIYKMKPTVLYSLFAIALLAAMGMKRLLLKAVLEDAWKLTERGWRKLTVQFAGFFLVMAALNEIAWRFVGEDFWVNFKVFGGVGLTLAFVMSRVPFAKKHALPEPKAEKPPKTAEPEQS